MSAKTAPTGKPRIPKKNLLLKQLHTWHWMSSAVAMIGLLLFAITGITLNHASEIEGKPVVTPASAVMPASLRRLLAPAGGADTKKTLPPEVADWLASTLGENAAGTAEWSASEVYLPLPRPGGDGWIAIDRTSGAVTSETTSRGWISYLNDLHKGRNTGTAWKWFIDIFAVACVVFAATGFFLLQLHSGRRPSTWPLVFAGLAIPVIIAVIFIH
ncbi:membrane protein [Polymorphobacter glacialis]|uniref:Membrane protein n=1 Tax=Sandarakinorhabdus glacialis TaxID=1614636 RepID=A0A916ZL67_9SPHN|nr:PepSY-associated TM helix domain-containing protein [Polymorphobacter glacialis]GGE02789.1 membrane protein [Polymorphobacter glacialis]